MKKKIKILIALPVILIILAALCVLLIPVKLQYKDGGTVEWKAIAYSYVKWTAFISYPQQTSLYLYPENQKSIDERMVEFQKQLYAEDMEKLPIEKYELKDSGLTAYVVKIGNLLTNEVFYEADGEIERREIGTSPINCSFTKKEIEQIERTIALESFETPPLPKEHFQNNVKMGELVKEHRKDFVCKTLTRYDVEETEITYVRIIRATYIGTLGTPFDKFYVYDLKTGEEIASGIDTPHPWELFGIPEFLYP